MSKEAFKAKKFSGFYFDPEDLILITDPGDPLYDPRVNLPVDPFFKADIAHRGIIQTVLITKRDGDPVVAAGRQRTKAAREINRERAAAGKVKILVPCKYERATSEDLFESSISENEQRIEDGPIDKAEKAARLISYGKTINEAARVFGVTAQTINTWLKYLDLPREQRKQISAGEVKPTNALKAIRLPEKKRKNAILPTRIKKKKVVSDKLSSVKSWNDDEYRRGFENALKWVLGE